MQLDINSTIFLMNCEIETDGVKENEICPFTWFLTR